MITASPGEAVDSRIRRRCTEQKSVGLHISMFRKVSSIFDKYVPLLKEAEITDKFIEKL